LPVWEIIVKDVKKKIEDELNALEKELHTVLPKAIKVARELGDLRENAEYHAAKERQTYVQARISQLQLRLARLSMVNLKNIPHDKASYGSTVVLYEPKTDHETTYRLVSSEEADVQAGRISTSSPIGRALMGHQEGDEVTIVTPGGSRDYEIRKLTTIYDQVDGEEDVPDK